MTKLEKEYVLWNAVNETEEWKSCLRLMYDMFEENLDGKKKQILVRWRAYVPKQHFLENNLKNIVVQALENEDIDVEVMKYL